MIEYGGRYGALKTALMHFMSLHFTLGPRREAVSTGGCAIGALFRNFLYIIKRIPVGVGQSCRSQVMDTFVG